MPCASDMKRELTTRHEPLSDDLRMQVYHFLDNLFWRNVFTCAVQRGETRTRGKPAASGNPEAYPCFGWTRIEAVGNRLPVLLNDQCLQIEFLEPIFGWWLTVCTSSVPIVEIEHNHQSRNRKSEERKLTSLPECNGTKATPASEPMDAFICTNARTHAQIETYSSRKRLSSYIASASTNEFSMLSTVSSVSTRLRIGSRREICGW